MKRLLSLVAVVLCVALMPQEASAQFDLGKAFGRILGAVAAEQQQPTKVSPYDELRNNAPTRTKILGTWQYKTASLKYLGDNPLADVALAQVEGFGLAELKKYGIMEGCCSLTLRRNGLAVLSTLDALQEGWFNYDETTAKMDVSSTVDGVTYRVKGYFRIVSERFMVMLDAGDVIDIIAKASPELTTDDTFIMLKGVLQSFGDVYLCIVFER